MTPTMTYGGKHELNRNLHNVADLERIAELEAERERLQDAIRIEVKARQAWEAEVERLTRECLALRQELDAVGKPGPYPWKFDDEIQTTTTQNDTGVNPSGLSLSAGKPRESCEFCGGPEHKDDSECPAWEGA